MPVVRVTGVPRLTEFSSAVFHGIFSPQYLWEIEKVAWHFAMKVQIYTTQIVEKQSNTMIL